MGFFDSFRKKEPVKSSIGDGGVLITTSQQLEEYIKTGSVSNSGALITDQTAMQVGAVFRSVSIIAGAVANMPLAIKERVNSRVREDASNHWSWRLLRKKPNSWMTSSGFRRLLTTHVLLRGNAYALKVVSMGRVIELIPLSPDKVTVNQLDDLSIVYTYQKKNGQKITIPQTEIFHLMNMSFDGIVGVTPIAYAKEAIGLSLQSEKHGASLFKNGTLVGSLLKHPKSLSPEAQQRLRDGLEQYRGSENSNKTMILEDGLEYESLGMTQEDAQFIETRKSSRTDIAMFFGVPPHMLGDTEKSTSWGTGIEQQSIGFVTYTLQDYLTMWEDTIDNKLINEDDIYAKFNTSGLVRGDIKTRWEAYTQAAQYGIMSPNEIRALEELNPREGGDEFYDPPNTNGTEGTANEPQTTTKY